MLPMKCLVPHPLCSLCPTVTLHRPPSHLVLAGHTHVLPHWPPTAHIGCRQQSELSTCGHIEFVINSAHCMLASLELHSSVVLCPLAFCTQLCQLRVQAPAPTLHVPESQAGVLGGQTQLFGPLLLHAPPTGHISCGGGIQAGTTSQRRQTFGVQGAKAINS